MKLKFPPLVLALVCSALLLPIFVIVSFFVVFSKRFYPNTFLVDIAVGGETKNEAKEKVAKVFDLLPPEKKIKFVFEEKSWEWEAEKDLNWRYEAEETVEKVFGSAKSLPLDRIFQKKVYPLEFSFDENLFEEKAATIAAEVGKKPVTSSIFLNKETGKVEISEGSTGLVLNKEDLRKEVSDSFSWLKFDEEIVLPTKEIGGVPEKEVLDEAMKRGEKLLGKTVTLLAKKQNFVLSDEQLIDFIDISSVWNEEKIKDYIASLAGAINGDAENALFQFENGKVTVFQEDKIGFNLDKEKSTEVLEKGLEEIISSDSKNIFKELAVAEISPAVKTSDTNRLGISGLLAEGESFFYHSIPSRIYNLDLASQKFHGVLIAPDEVFSFNKVVGEISKDTGFKDAYIIQNGKTILGAGGGVCQVSTTMFRAALNAGLPISERHPHAYRVSYYEYRSKPGFDAGVFSPTADLKFKNDTGAYILIQRVFEPKDLRLVFRFYGNSDNRKVKIENIKLWGVTPPPEDLYIDDATMPQGTVKQVDFKAWGAKASFDWSVEKDGQILHEQTFFSTYRPWQAIYLKGTKQN